ncbi:SDR family oxidoreductase [bacterium]|nr:SDR family oxidoreductase [bacterium]
MTKTVLITGASGGIGAELVPFFAEAGYHLILVARSEDLLHRIKDRMEKDFNSKVVTYRADLSIRNERDELIAKIEAEKHTVEILVNNAGFGLHGTFANLSLEKQLEMIELNISAVTHLTRAFLPKMVENESGKILNVASVAAFSPGPNMAVYYASKAFVLSFSNAIASELKGSGVTVTTLCPGPVATNFGKVAKFEHSKSIPMQSVTAAEVARQAFDGVMAGKRVVLPGFTTKLSAFLPRLVPTAWVSAIVKSFQATRK